MDKGKERGILKLDPRPRVIIDTRSELTPQVSYDRPPSSPQPSVDRLSVTWADPGSMASSGVNLFHLPSETPVSNEVKFSTSAGDGSEDEDYSASLSAVLRQRRASVRRSRKGRARRPSSPFMQDEPRARRRSSVFTTSSGDTAISMDEGQPAVVTQEQIFENIHLHKEVLGSVKQQPLGMRRKLKIVHQAKAYIKRHEGQLQERLAQSKSTRDIYARFNILLATKWQQLKREAANTSNLLIPWELRIKEIESHFGSVVASYFTFLRWLFWVNLVIAFILLVFVIVPEYLTANALQDGERKIIMEEERMNASNLLTLWEFEGVLKFSPIFYGYYSNIERPQYRMPLAYFLTGLAVYIYSFVAILRKMAENSRMSKLSEKDDECIFSWKLFTGWDFMIGNAETAHNRIASVILGFKEALLEEAEKKKDLRNWRIISLRAIVNICVVILLAVSAFAVVGVVSRSDDKSHPRSWWRENETTIVVTVISITFPVFFELLGFLEHYHPRKQLRLQLARIMLLNLLNLYSLIFALFSKIGGMSIELEALKPNLTMNATTMSTNALNISQSLALNLSMTCYEVSISCAPCNVPLKIPVDLKLPIGVMPINLRTTPGLHSTTTSTAKATSSTSSPITRKPKSAKAAILQKANNKSIVFAKKILPQNLIEKETKTISEISTTTENSILQDRKQLEKIKKLFLINTTDLDDTSSEIGDEDYTFEDYSAETTSVSLNMETIPLVIVTGTYETSEISTTITDEIVPSTNMISSSMSSEMNSETDEESTTLYYTDSTETIESNSDATDSTTSTDFSTDSTWFNVVTSSSKSVTETESPYYTNDYSITSPSSEETELFSTSSETDSTVSSIFYSDTSAFPNLSTVVSIDAFTICPNITFNCTVNCGGKNVTQVFYISNCTVVEKRCYTTLCVFNNIQTNTTMIDFVYEDKNTKKMYNLTKTTRKKLLKLCWETMFGQELVKLTMMDLVFVLLGTLFMDFFRALFVRYMNRCWCWDLEKKFPEYGDFKIAENILHLINNQGMVWMGMFFSPGLVVLNVSKLMIMMYLRSWAVMTCNVPHEVVFRVSKSNNFYLALLLTMLFLCVLPVGYAIVWVKPSWHCGPFSEYDQIYSILTRNIYDLLPDRLNFALEYIASPAIVIPLLVLLILIIYYLTSLTNSLREANNDLKIQLRRERTEERRKMFQLADTRRRAGSSALDNTPFARWKKALGRDLPLSKSIDSDERKTVTEDTTEPLKATKKRGGIFARIVDMARDKKLDVEAVPEAANNVSPSSNNADDETDTDFHETLPKEILKIKDITISKLAELRKKSNVEFKTERNEESKKADDNNLMVKSEKTDDRTEKNAVIEKQEQEKIKGQVSKPKPVATEASKDKTSEDKKLSRNQTSESSTQSRKSDSIGSVIPVITISTTESDDEILQCKKGKTAKGKEKKDTEEKKKEGESSKSGLRKTKNSSDLKSLRRQSSVDSVNEQKVSQKEKKPEEGSKYQYSL